MLFSLVWKLQRKTGIASVFLFDKLPVTSRPTSNKIFEKKCRNGYFKITSTQLVSFLMEVEIQFSVYWSNHTCPEFFFCSDFISFVILIVDLGYYTLYITFFIIECNWCEPWGRLLIGCSDVILCCNSLCILIHICNLCFEQCWHIQCKMSNWSMNKNFFFYRLFVNVFILVINCCFWVLLWLTERKYIFIDILLFINHSK